MKSISVSALARHDLPAQPVSSVDTKKKELVEIQDRQPGTATQRRNSERFQVKYCTSNLSCGTLYATLYTSTVGFFSR